MDEFDKKVTKVDLASSIKKTSELWDKINDQKYSIEGMKIDPEKKAILICNVKSANKFIHDTRNILIGIIDKGFDDDKK